MANNCLVKPLNCSVSSLQPITIGSTRSRNGCAAIEVQFPDDNVVNIGKVSFVNNYTAHISVKIKVHGKPSTGCQKAAWKTGVRMFTLMPKPHCDYESQSFFSLFPRDFSHDPSSVSALRIVLYQPSPNWKTFSLEELKVYPVVPYEVITGSIPKYLVESKESASTKTASRDKAILVGLPDSDEITMYLQHLWMLLEKVMKSRPSIELGRFEIDDSYEISFLPLT